VNYFLQYNRVVSGAPTWEKTALVGTNNIIEDRPKAMNQDLCNDFVNYVAKADGSKVFECLWRVYFGDESNKGVCYGRVKVTSLESFVNKKENIIPDNVPVLFKENAMKPI